jgi:hypothetical protein
MWECLAHLPLFHTFHMNGQCNLATLMAAVSYGSCTVYIIQSYACFSKRHRRALGRRPFAILSSRTHPNFVHPTGTWHSAPYITVGLITVLHIWAFVVFGMVWGFGCFCRPKWLRFAAVIRDFVSSLTSFQIQNLLPRYIIVCTCLNLHSLIFKGKRLVVRLFRFCFESTEVYLVSSWVTHFRLLLVAISSALNAHLRPVLDLAIISVSSLKSVYGRKVTK